MRSLAIVGSGIAGMGLAYKLKDLYRITVFDGNAYAGGHTNTISVPSKEHSGGQVAFDTGFMVFNYQTYPLLTAMFKELDVPVKKTDMSFSVQIKEPGRTPLEWNGAGLDKIFAQRRNLFSPRFWRMLRQLDWFNKNAPIHLETVDIASLKIRDYIDKYSLSADFLNWYMIPMGSSVWSTPFQSMLDFPAATLLRFFHNHGFLGLDTHYQWYTVDGGAIQYMKRLAKSLKADDRVLTSSKVDKVFYENDRPTVLLENGKKEAFDLVCLACHADEALAMLTSPTELEQHLLVPFKYQNNDITVHTDNAVMPASRRAWASWNHRVEGGLGTTHYWMNNLQSLDGETNYFVSLNAASLIDQEKVLRKMNYTHPLFNLDTFKAQPDLYLLNQQEGRSIFFAGSYFRYGFHEDAFMSAVQLAERLSHLKESREPAHV